MFLHLRTGCRTRRDHLEGHPMSADMETDLTGEIEEARQLAHEAECHRRDIEQGVTALGEVEP
jgi:hypothetical protein